MPEETEVVDPAHIVQVARVARIDRTSVRCLDTEGRVQELARMLSGSTITPAAVANARALLNA